MIDWLQLIGPAGHLTFNADHNSKFVGRCGFSTRIVKTTKEDVQQAISDCPARVVTFRALWCPIEIITRICAAFPSTRFIIHNHSSIQQSADGPEWEVLQHFQRNGRDARNLWFANTGSDMCAFQRALGIERTVYIPNFVHADSWVSPARNKPDEMFHVAMFLALRATKNWATMMAALALVQRELRDAGRRLALHITQRPGSYQREIAMLSDAILAAGGCVVNEGFMSDREELLRVCSRMDVHVQVSYAETFCYGAADAIQAGRPVVGSPAIQWLPLSWTAPAHEATTIARKVLDAPGWDMNDGRRAVRAHNRSCGPTQLAGLGLCDIDTATELVLQNCGGMI